MSPAIDKVVDDAQQKPRARTHLVSSVVKVLELFITEPAPADPQLLTSTAVRPATYSDRLGTVHYRSVAVIRMRGHFFTRTRCAQLLY